MKILAVSMNMSFASDMGEAMGSEKHFISQLKDKKLTEGLRTYWVESVSVLRSLLTSSDFDDYAKCVGIQELNDNTKEKGAGGFQAIIKSITEEEFPEKEFKKNVPVIYTSDKYSFVIHRTEHKIGYPTIMTIWETEKFGECVLSCGSDLESMGYIKKGGKTIPPDRMQTTVGMAGRPITFTYTSKGYVLINLHNVNEPKDYGMDNFKENMKILWGFFMEKLGTNRVIKNIIAMGDFNDPYGYLADSGLNLGKYKLKTGKVISCCYNYNSSCPHVDVTTTTGKVYYDFMVNHTNKVVFRLFDPRIGDYNDTYDDVDVYYQAIQTGDGKRHSVEKFTFKELEKSFNNDYKLHVARPRQCFQPVKFDIKYNSMTTEKEGTPMNGDRAKISSYRFYGDYCMGLGLQEFGLLSELLGYGNKEVSTKSDHEFVYGVFNDKKVRIR